MSAEDSAGRRFEAETDAELHLPDVDGLVVRIHSAAKPVARRLGQGQFDGDRFSRTADGQIQFCSGKQAEDAALEIVGRGDVASVRLQDDVSGAERVCRG